MDACQNVIESFEELEKLCDESLENMVNWDDIFINSVVNMDLSSLFSLCFQLRVRIRGFIFINRKWWNFN